MEVLERLGGRALGLRSRIEGLQMVSQTLLHLTSRLRVAVVIPVVGLRGAGGSYESSA
jgi:hypothetical protein